MSDYLLKSYVKSFSFPKDNAPSVHMLSFVEFFFPTIMRYLRKYIITKWYPTSKI